MIKRVEFNWYADKDGEHFLFYEVGEQEVSSIQIVGLHALITYENGNQHIITNINSIFYEAENK